MTILSSSWGQRQRRPDHECGVLGQTDVASRRRVTRSTARRYRHPLQNPESRSLSRYPRTSAPVTTRCDGGGHTGQARSRHRKNVVCVESWGRQRWGPARMVRPLAVCARGGLEPRAYARAPPCRGVASRVHRRARPLTYVPSSRTARGTRLGLPLFCGRARVPQTRAREGTFLV